MPQVEAATACALYGETLLTKATLSAHKTDFIRSLSYQAFAGRALPLQPYYISGGVVVVAGAIEDLTFESFPARDVSLPVLCTQTSQESQPGNSSATSASEVIVVAKSNTFIGFRNQKSFRFLGIPYADEPERFHYSSLYSLTGQAIQATSYGSQCAQPSSGSEACHFLNIQTPYIPKVGSNADLRPVMFWIHGGGFTGGTGADPLSDGGNLASREDIVVVTFNYRLSTLGFLAIPGTNITGNFGIQDQTIALQWTVNNIAFFGGDPGHITIVGESAGAGSVRVLLGSPAAIGKYQGAISMSNLGGGVSLGLSSDYATTYSSYLTIPESYSLVGQAIFSEAGCNQSTLGSQIECLETVPALKLVELSTVARYVVQDGVYVDTEQLVVSTRNASTAHVPVMFGIMRDDGASICTYPSNPVTSELDGLEASLGISAAYAREVISSGLFPMLDTGNLTLDAFNVSARVATDVQFRCIDQATVYAGTQTQAFPSAYFYQMNRGINGYDPNNVGNPPATPGYPNGNPNLPYFRVHAADMTWVFGNLAPNLTRDADDLYFTQLASGYWAEFVRCGQPNPSMVYPLVFRYTKTIQAIENSGPWEAVSGAQGYVEQLDYPALRTGFVDLEQCAFLNYSLAYYLDSNRG
ncbi:putative carboxylesterase family protein [Phaeomoniella chlamydospora]|uniref:Carboxylic ester hydrolase n=1 Tax=Phaeomoniella chlamydospora TaxID=158046 RepID=A0A0G2GK68_PHACM|nr:putative carboxylesterase family protein [Phaeomoniella chlamydospora]